MIYNFTWSNDSIGMVGVNYAQVPMGGPFQPQGGYSKPPAGAGGTTPTAAEQKNFTGEVFFDDVGQGADGNRPKRVRERGHYLLTAILLFQNVNCFAETT